MSWKLAEWRWREQAPLRQRSLWKIWDIEDAVKNGDVVEEAVRFAYHFSDQVDACWQSRIETPLGKGLGSIRSGKNPHPPPQSQLPDLPPQHLTSYHPSQTSSAPLLGSFEKTPPITGASRSASSSLLSDSICGTPTVAPTPRTPQLATDFLDSRDWNHLAVDQNVHRETAVNQLRSSFGLLTKAIQYPRSRQRPTLDSQYHRLERANTSATPLLSEPFRSSSNLRRRHQSTQKLDASFNSFPDRVVPWSNLDTVFKDRQFLLNNRLRHDNPVLELCRPKQIPFELFSEEQPDFNNSFHKSTSVLLPNEDMGRFNLGKAEDGESNNSKPKRVDTPPARVYEDLPTAYTEIVGQAGTPVREMRNMTGVFANLPPTIDLPRTPARPGPVSPAVQQKLAEARALRFGQNQISSPERPLTPLLPDSPIAQLRAAREGHVDDDIVPASDSISREGQINELRRAISPETMPTDRVLVRNIRSFFDLDHEYRTQGTQSVQQIGSRRPFASASDSTVGSLGPMHSPTAPRDNDNTIVRSSLDIMGIAISGDHNYILSGQGRGDLLVPASLRMGQRRLSASIAPREELPRVPSGVQRFHHQRDDLPDSEVAEYDNTQSLLNPGRPGQRVVDTSEGFQTQIVSNKREIGDDSFHNVGKNMAIAAAVDPEAQYPASGAADFGHELTRCSARQPTSHSPGQFNDATGGAGISVAVEFHDAVNQEAGYDETDFGSPGPAIRTPSPLKLFADKGLLKNDSGNQGAEHEVARQTSDEVDSFRCNLDSAEWLANPMKKEVDFLKKAGIENDSDWETVRGSGIDSDQLVSQAALQPPQPRFEPRDLRSYQVDLRSDPSLASSSIESLPTSQDQPATPWGPIQKGTRTHPGRAGTPHRYRLRRNTSTGENIYVPEYSLPEISSSNDNTESAQAAPDLPADYLFPISKFSASTSRQQVQEDETSSDQEYPSSPPVFSQGRHKAGMATAREEHERAQGRIVHELKGDQVHGIGVAISTHVSPGDQERIARAESVYSLSSEDIVQDEPLRMGAIVGPRPANIPGTRAIVEYASSDDVSMRDGMHYGEQAGGIEMERMGTGRDISIGTMGTLSSGDYVDNSYSQFSGGWQSRLMSQGRNESDEEVFKRLSTIDDDGSYDGGEGITYLQANDSFTPRSVQSNKSAFQGGIGKYRDRAMRGTGSSLAYESPNTYTPATQRNHSYANLSSGPDSIRGADEDVNTIKIASDNVQKDIPDVEFPTGQAIGAPKPCILPRTVPASNSFVLTKEMPLIHGTADEEDVEDRIRMAQDDWMRLKQPCPVFPLRHSHLGMLFVEGDARGIDEQIYNRSDAYDAHGILQEDGFCFFHGRREWSTAPVLRNMPLSVEMERIRKDAGRKVVFTCLCVPVVGWILLYYLYKDEPGMKVDGDLVRWKTGGLVVEMGDEEKALAGRVLLWGALGAVGGLLACVAVLVWALL